MACWSMHYPRSCERPRDSLSKSPWMRRMDLNPVPTEGRGSRLRGNDGFGAAGMTGFRRVVERFLRFFGVRPSE